MPNLITIWTFQYQHQMLVIRGRLDAEGIETFTHDEITIQVDPLYSNALGGIKLMVQPQDAQKASEILAEAGYIKQPEEPDNEFLQKLYSFTGSLGLIGSLKFEHRIFILVALFVMLLAIGIYTFVA